MSMDRQQMERCLERVEIIVRPAHRAHGAGITVAA